MGFRGKQIATLTLVAAAVALATGLMNVVAMTRIAVHETRDRAEFLARTLYHQARAALGEQAGAGTDLASALSADPALRTFAQAVVGYSETVLYLAIVDDHERIVFHSDPLQEGKPLRPAESIAQFSERATLTQLWLLMQGDRVLTADLPFGLEGERPAGTVRVALSALLLKTKIAGAVAQNTALAAGVVLVVFLTSFYLANRLLAPLEMLRRELGQIDFGGDRPPLELRNRADIGRVSEFFASVSRRLAEDRQLRETEHTWLETMLGGLSDAVFVVNRDRRILSLNAPAATILGRERSELHGQTLEQVLPQTSPLRSIVWDALERGESRAAHTVELSVGGRRIAHTLSAQILHEGDRVTGVIVTGRDLEKLTRLGSHLSYTQKLAALGQLTSGVSHEIKNPLNAMVLHVSLLRAKCDDVAVQHHLDALDREVRYLERVVDGFLSFTRPDKLRLDAAPVDEVLATATPLVSGLAEKNGIRIETTIMPGLAPIYGDRELLRQAFSNLLLNACEAMPEGGLLRLEARRTGDGQLAIVVEDTGVGIAPAEIPKIFKLYYTTKGAGSGIGLALAYRIVQLHGGEITVDSRPGSGSRFTVLLPELAP